MAAEVLRDGGDASNEHEARQKNPRDERAPEDDFKGADRVGRQFHKGTHGRKEKRVHLGFLGKQLKT